MRAPIFTVLSGASLQGEMMARYTITSIDNNSIGAGGSSAIRGEFDDSDAALARAQQLVNGALQDRCTRHRLIHPFPAR